MHNIFNKFTFLSYLVLSLFACNIYAVNNLPIEEMVPGGVAKINLDIKTDEVSKPPEAFFDGEKLLVYKHNGFYHALVGLPLSLKPGKHKLEYTTKGGFNSYKEFQVTKKKYNVSRIKIKNKNMVNPDSKTQVRIMDDAKRIRAAVGEFTENFPSKLVLQQPVRGIPTTSFGARRIINGQSKNPHSGMDIAAAKSTPVDAAGDGKVVLADNFYLSGNLVAIDHGSGLFTLYAHLSEFFVNVGDTVKAGDRIGRVGNTGRVTGPHLHWTVRVNGTPVNPALFVEKIKHGRNNKNDNTAGFGI